MLTAGHCFRNSKSLILHFNTGLSSSTGHPADAHPNDQYPTVPTSVALLDSGIGADWGICRLAKNSNTGKYPGQAQGSWYGIGTVPTSSTGQRIDITGYGVTTPPGLMH